MPVGTLHPPLQLHTPRVDFSYCDLILLSELRGYNSLDWVTLVGHAWLDTSCNPCYLYLMNRNGRPPGPVKNRRTHIVHLRLNWYERRRVEALMRTYTEDGADGNMSAFLRQVVDDCHAQLPLNQQVYPAKTAAKTRLAQGKAIAFKAPAKRPLTKT